MGITKLGEKDILSENPSSDDVVLFMKNSQSDDDWNNRIDEVKVKFGDDYPDFWYEKIVAAGIRSNGKNKSEDVKILTSADVQYLFNPIEELGKKEDVLSDIDDLQSAKIYNRPTAMPHLMGGYKFICGYDQGLGERFFVCNTLEGAQTLYDKYAQGWARNINRYTGKLKKDII